MVNHMLVSRTLKTQKGTRQFLTWASLVALVIKNLPFNARDIRDVILIPGWG